MVLGGARMRSTFASALLGGALIAACGGRRDETDAHAAEPLTAPAQIGNLYGSACWVDRAGGARCEGGPVAGLEKDVVAIMAGWHHACAQRTDGTFWCWGMNRAGELGQAVAGDPWAEQPATPLPPAQSPYVAVAAGALFTCAIDRDGAVWCHGTILGSGAVARGVTVSGARPVEIAAGNGHACVRRSDGSVACWGNNDRGQLGAPAFSALSSVAAAVEVVLPRPAVQVSLGADFGCARLIDASVWCWGSDTIGELGDREDFSKEPVFFRIPKRVDGLPPAAALSVGEHHGCVLGEDAAVWCWGDNASRQLGFASPGSSAHAGRVPGVPAVAQLAAGRGLDSCVLTVDGEIWCWGGVTGSRQNVAVPQRVGVR